MSKPMLKINPKNTLDYLEDPIVYDDKNHYHSGCVLICLWIHTGEEDENNHLSPHCCDCLAPLCKWLGPSIMAAITNKGTATTQQSAI
ncbi:hypothetical protein CDAR_564421 [Caerostris darwini]|uniref:Uncharacterized protein n=1 Tax=Caerostris darwini TaxID=1538125 RepID=A0AAV4TP27_9ARAC|nr:hypothetical protein CDAR_564421 [Caerostris darwini]